MADVGTYTDLPGGQCLCRPTVEKRTGSQIQSERDIIFIVITVRGGPQAHLFQSVPAFVALGSHFCLL